VCRRAGVGAVPLRIGTVVRRDDDVLVEGLLVCTNDACQREYPILDGIPILVGPLREFLAENLLQATARDDLSPLLESVLGDCAGPASAFDVVRHQLNCYAWDHYATHDPDEPRTARAPGAAVRVLGRGLALAGDAARAPAVDLGCGVGGTTFDLAERTTGLVLGIDLNLAMLRLASRVLRTGVVQYPRKRTGVVYDRRVFDVPFARREAVDFWACDVAALPFDDDTFGLGVAMNVIDCVRAPRDVIAEAGRVLAPGAPLVITSPYDWAATATPIETWLGGHSQRGPLHGDGAAVLRALLTPSAGHPAAFEELAIEAEIPELPWHVRLHDRSTVEYAVHLVLARKRRRAVSEA
jgi:SAM-dependent methyltransferase/uncharacterized protein YbaR (Trm112 family)